MDPRALRRRHQRLNPERPARILTPIRLQKCTRMLGEILLEAAEEGGDLEVDLDRVAGVRKVAGALDDDELAAGQVGDDPAAFRRLAHVAVAVDHEHRAADLSADLGRGVGVAAQRRRGPGAVVGEHDLGGRAARPSRRRPRAASWSAVRAASGRRRSRRSHASRAASSCRFSLAQPSSLSRTSSKSAKPRCGCGGVIRMPGLIATTPSARSGCSAARSSDSPAPEQTPTSTARSTSAASSTASASASSSPSLYATGSVVRLLPPLPGGSNVTTVCRRANHGTCAFHICESTIVSPPKNSSAGSPSPKRSHAMSTSPRRMTPATSG